MKYYEDWTDEGICRQTDPELWYPEKGGCVNDAVTICQGCPVKRQCLDTAMRAEVGKCRQYRLGIWGSLTPRAREKFEPEWLALQAGVAA
jgi:WhiB family redox-sensing transcriptional regulator